MSLGNKLNLYKEILILCFLQSHLVICANEQFPPWERSDTSERFMYLSKAKVHTNPSFRDGILNKPPNYFRHHHMQNLRQKYEVPEDDFISIKSGPTNHQILGQPVDDVERLILEDLLQQTNNFTSPNKTKTKSEESEIDSVNNSSNQKVTLTRTTKRIPKLAQNNKTTKSNDGVARSKHRYFISLDQTPTIKPVLTKVKQLSRKENREQATKNLRKGQEKPKSEEKLNMEDVSSFKQDLLDYDEAPFNSRKVKKNAVTSTNKPYQYLLPEVFTAQTHEVKQQPKPSVKPTSRSKVKDKKYKSTTTSTRKPVLLKKEDQVVAGTHNSDEANDFVLPPFKFPAELDVFHDDDSFDYSGEASNTPENKKFKVSKIIETPTQAKNIYQ